MKRALTCVVGLGLACACGSSPLGPTNGGHGAESTGGATLPSVLTVYTATLTASATCAFVLQPEARERTYTATLRSDGTIEWSSPTLGSPLNHATISSGVLSDDVISFSIDIERDPMSDEFYGLWDDFGTGRVLLISGKGRGIVREPEVSGRFEGIFAVDDPLDPPQPGPFIPHYCQATDHQFRFVSQHRAARSGKQVTKRVRREEQTMRWYDGNRDGTIGTRA